MPNSLSFSQRTDWSLASNQFSDDLNDLRKGNVPIVDLTESNPTNCGFLYPKNDIIASLAEDTNLCYMPAPRGNLQTREAVCRYYKEKGLYVVPEQIFLTASTSEAYSYLFRLLVDPGEGVLFPCPSYPLFSFLGDLNDVRIDTYPLIYQEQWSIDLQGMRRVICNDTKAVVLVNPNNPTGSFIHREELEEINTLCREQNIALVCDEVFSDFAFDQADDHVSLVSNDQVLTFVLGGISKMLGLPQMKLSWIIVNGPKDLVNAATDRLEVIADTYLSVNTPTQNAFPLWLSHRKTIQAEINNRIKDNLDFLKQHITKMDACEYLAADGGWYAVVKIPDCLSEEQWVLTFLNKDHVAVHPGYFFDFPQEAYVVVSLLPMSGTFQKGIKRIIKRIESRLLSKEPKNQTC